MKLKLLPLSILPIVLLYGLIAKPVAAETIAEPALSAAQHNSHGTIALERQEYQDAARSYQKAAASYKEKGNFEGYLGATTNQSLALQGLGQYQQAAKLLRSINVDKHTKNLELKAKYQKSLGVAFATIGRFEEATQFLDKAFKTTKDTEVKAAIAIDLGNISASENPQVAIEHYKNAIKLTRNPKTTAVATVAIVEPLYYTREIEQASQYLEQAKEIDNPNYETQLNIIARSIWLESQSGLTQIGQNEIAQLQNIARIGSTRQRSYAYGYLGRIAEMEENLETAIKLNQKAIEQAHIILNEPETAYQWQHQQGRVYATLGDRTSAIANYTSAVESIERVRSNLIAYNKDLQYSYKEKLEPVYRELVSLLTEVPNQKNLIAARDTIESLQIAELENYFRQACLTGKPEQIDNIDPRAATIYPIVLEDKLATIVAVAGQPLTYHEAAVGKTQVKQTISNFLINSNIAASTKRRLASGEQIYSWLVEPHQQQFEEQNIETLVFIPDSGMRNLPLAAINDSAGNYLIQNYELAVTPGLQLLPDETENENIRAVIGGLSESNEGFTALPGVDTEVATLSETVASTVLLNNEFTKQELKTTLANQDEAGILHLATHGQFSSNPEETFVKTYNDRINVNELDDLLRVRQETPRLKPIDLFVLSACSTAAGDERAALGLAGVAVRSGARTTIGTLWSVKDESTAILIEEMYRNLEQNKGKGESLRAAQLKLIEHKEFNHPSFWSPFLLVGQWQ